MDTYSTLFEEINRMEIVDTHEHLPNAHTDDLNPDFLSEYFCHYIADDLISGGMTQETLDYILDGSQDLMQRYDRLDPYWQLCRRTGYGKCLTLSSGGLYGIDEISRDTVQELDRRYKESLGRDKFDWILREKLKAQYCLDDFYFPRVPEKDYFVDVFHIDILVFANLCDLPFVENYTGLKIGSFEDWLAAVDRFIEIECGQNRKRVLKTTLAYYKELSFAHVSKETAKAEFDRKMASKETEPMPYNSTVNLELTDFMLHYVLNRIQEYPVTLQIHTGIFAKCGNDIRHSNPMHLIPLFNEYPKLHFDIFHIGYPFQNGLIALVKSFPNVTINMCWAHMISPRASVNTLLELFDTTPLNKINGFGGDCIKIDLVYGHKIMTCQNLAKALAIKVDGMEYTMKEAKEIARRILYLNPMQLVQGYDK